MKPPIRFSHVLAVCTLLFGSVAPLMAQEQAVVVYLVRHAEKIDDSRDPALSNVGKERASLLARMLHDAGVTHLWSTDYLRTQHTAQPLATAAGLAVTSYDPRDLSAFAAKLRSIPGRHLVVGHSNTTPQLVAALGGVPGTPIDDGEYDRLYVVAIVDGTVSTVLLRFGCPAPPLRCVP